MKVLFLLLVLLIPCSLWGQVLAGQASADQSVIEVGYDVQSSEPWFIDTLSLDLNCDASTDLRLTFNVGQPEVDGPHMLWFLPVNPDLSVSFNPSVDLSDMAAFFFEADESIEETSPPGWESEAGIIASIGGWWPQGEALIENKYLGYRLGEDFGWIEVSYDLTNSIIGMSVPRFLSTCLVDDVPALEQSVSIGPNPVQNQEVFLSHSNLLQKAELIGLNGIFIKSWDSPGKRLDLNVGPGSYVLVLTTKSGLGLKHVLVVEE